MKLYRAYSPSRNLATSPQVDLGAAQGMAKAMNQGAVTLNQEQDWKLQVSTVEWEDIE